jgi:hypothetical protein
MVSALTRVFVQRANEVAEYFAERMTSSVGNGNAISECQSAIPDQLPNMVQIDPLKLHYHQPTPPGTKFAYYMDSEYLNHLNIGHVEVRYSNGPVFRYPVHSYKTSPAIKCLDNFWSPSCLTIQKLDSFVRF